MDYAKGGDLLTLTKSKGRLSEAEARPIFRQILFGLAHIHCRSVVHRDIKLDNILLFNDDNHQTGGTVRVKICDFGVSKIFKKGSLMADQCGTPAYLAPEIVQNKSYSGFQVDIWSLGVLLFGILCGHLPFKAPTLAELHKQISKGAYFYSVNLSSEAQNLIANLIRVRPDERLTIP